MGLEQAITHGKEHRKEYRGGKACCKSCRNHGGCPVCEGNRAYSTVKGQQAADAAMDQDFEPYYIDDSAAEIREEICPDPWDRFNQDNENR